MNKFKYYRALLMFFTVLFYVSIFTIGVSHKWNIVLFAAIFILSVIAINVLFILIAINERKKMKKGQNDE